MKKFWKKTEGFTLIELIVVIAILGILAGVGTVGYSGYIKKANMAADETLASEIKNALTLAHYSGKLTPGDYVVVRYGEDAVSGNNDDSTSTTAANAMAVAFGDSWNESLNLSFGDWELGVVADSEMMDFVNASSYNGGGLNNLLGKVQTVVTAAGNYLEGTTLDNEQLLAYLNKTDIVLGEGNTVTAENASAVANTAVFSVANTIVSSKSVGTDMFHAMWTQGVVSGEDQVANEAAKYSLALGLATYLDNTTKDTADPTSYVLSLEVDEDTLESNPKEILNRMDALLEDVYGRDGDNVAALRDQYLGVTFDEEGNLAAVNKDAQGYKDSMAFLSYMDGVENASDTMLETYDIYNANYFGDGTMASYVQNYIDTGAVLSGLNISEDAFVFVYDGINVVCNPLDY